jgi:hypothetical protein
MGEFLAAIEQQHFFMERLAQPLGWRKMGK